jgi:CDP-paratose 2-epimerase
MISAAAHRPITIYGNGKQVRDILYVDDLLRAFRLAVERIDTTAGEVYNIGGGPENTLSVWAEFGDVLSALGGTDVDASFDGWRPGDQPCYVSDIRKAERDMGWRPEVSSGTGLERLWEWVQSAEVGVAGPVAAAVGVE